MASPPSPWRKIADWILESLKFAVAVVIFFFLDKVVKKPAGLPGEMAVTGLVALLSSILGLAFLSLLYLFIVRPTLSVIFVLDKAHMPSERPEIDLASNPDRGISIQVDYAHGGFVGKYVEWRSQSVPVHLKIGLAPNGRLIYTAQTVFPGTGTTVGPDGVKFDVSNKLVAGVVEGCEISVSAVASSQVPLQLKCVTSVESASGRRWPTHRMIKVECNVVGFTVRSM